MKKVIFLIISCTSLGFSQTEEDLKKCVSENFYIENFKASILCLDKLIAQNPKDSTLYNDRGSIKEILHDYKGALIDFDKQLSIDSTFADTYFFKAMLYEKMSKKDLALKNYTKTIEYEPNNSDAYFFRGKLYYYDGNEESAYKDFETALEKRPNNENVYGFEALDYIKKNQFDTADKMANRGLFIYENCIDCLLAKSIIEYKKNPNIAFEYLFKAFKSNANTIETIPFSKAKFDIDCAVPATAFFENQYKILNTAEDFTALGKMANWLLMTNLSTKYYLKSCSIKTNYVNTYLLAKCFFESKNYNNALQYCNKSLLEKSTFEEVKILKINTLLELKKYKKALTVANDLVNQNPYNPKNYILRGKIYTKLKNKFKAKQDLETAKTKML